MGQKPLPIAIIPVLLVTAVLLVYLQVVRFDFVNYDDDRFVYENEHIRGGLSAQGIAWAFRTLSPHNWHPLTWISYQMDYTLFGHNPGGYHLTNLLFHMAATLLLFLLLYTLTQARWRSAIVALLFAIHPAHVESVAWVAERKDVLSAFFWMLTLVLYVSYARRPRPLMYILAAVSFAAGLMSKSMLVTLPCVMLLLDYWPLERLSLDRERWAEWRTLAVEKLPFFGLTAVCSVIQVVAQREGGAVAAIEFASVPTRLMNAVVSYLTYIEKMLWPTNLAVFYPHLRDALPMWRVGAALVVLVMVSAAVVRFGKRYPYLLVGWLWFLGTLVPVIGLIQVGAQGMADRYTYIPSIGFFIMVVWGIHDVAKRFDLPKGVLEAAATVSIAALVVCANIQTTHWRNSETLWKHTLEVTSKNDKAHYNLGMAFAAQDRLDEAGVQFGQAVKANPLFDMAYNNLGNVMYLKGNYEGAAEAYAEALRLNPNNAQARDNMLRVQGKKQQP